MSYRSHLSRSSYYGQRPHGYGSGYGWATGFTGVLDTLSSFPRSFWSFARRGTRRWRGPVGRLYRTSDGVEIDIYGSGRWGLVDPNEIRAFNGWNITPNSSAVDKWTGRGTSPPTVSLNQTYLGEPCASITFAAGTSSGYSTSRADRNESGGTFSLVSGVTYLMGIDVSLSRPLTGSESIYVYYTGTASGTPFNITVANDDDMVGAWKRITTTPWSHTATGSHWVAVYPNTAIGASPLTVYVKRIQVEAASVESAYEERTTYGAGNSLWQKLYDQTGAGRHFEQASNLIMPYACRQGVSVTENGIQSAEFVAADARRMAVPSSESLYRFLYTTGGTVGIVSRSNNTSAVKVLLSNRQSSARAGVYVYRGSGEQFAMSSGRQDVAGVATDGVTAVNISSIAGLTNKSCVAVFDVDSATAAERAKLYIDNTLDPTINIETATPFVENSEGLLTLGATSVGNIPHDGTISELAIWDSLIDSGVRGSLWSDASELWGLA